MQRSFRYSHVQQACFQPFDMIISPVICVNPTTSARANCNCRFHLKGGKFTQPFNQPFRLCDFTLRPGPAVKGRRDRYQPKAGYPPLSTHRTGSRGRPPLGPIWLQGRQGQETGGRPEPLNPTFSATYTIDGQTLKRAAMVQAIFRQSGLAINAAVAASSPTALHYITAVAAAHRDDASPGAPLCPPWPSQTYL